MTIDALITGLSKELELSATEIADTIWLAMQIEVSPAESIATAGLRENPPQPPLERGEQEVLPELQQTDRLDLDEPTPQPPSDEPKAGIYPYNPQEPSLGSGLSLKVPDAPSLREPLTLARALKPLMRRLPSGMTMALDEAATTQQIAETGLWLPVQKPTLEPWLDLELVVDEGISMQIWRHTIGELERLLKNYGIFRDVRVWGLTVDERERVHIRRGIGATAKDRSLRSPAELIDPSGRRLVLVVSDCVSPLWRDRQVTATLELWAKQGTMAIVQMLPKWLWKRTALGRASEVWLQGLNPGDFNQKLIAQGVSLWDELDETRGVKVPVFTLEPNRVAIWAQMLAGRGGISTTGYLFKLDPIPVKQGRELFTLDVDRSTPDQRVQAFRVTASPMARKLAGLLAAAPVISLPIVRLIQETLLKESQQVHVAEVFLGGLLKPFTEINPETNPNYVQYEFMDGVRELLADSVPEGYVLDVVEAVSKYVARKLGLSLEEFAAVLRNLQQVMDSETAEQVRYFATIAAQILRRLGGEYTKLADSLEKYNSKKSDDREEKDRQYWLFQINFEDYRVLDNTIDIIDLEEMPWLLNLSSKTFSVGDEVMIWVSGKRPGIYAFAKIIEHDNILEETSSIHYWLNANIVRKIKAQPRLSQGGLTICLTRELLDEPILEKELEQDPRLKDLPLSLNNHDSIFKVSAEQWQLLHISRGGGHFSTLHTKINDLEILKTTLRDLGLNCKTEADVRGYKGQRVRADVVAILEGEYDLGWSRDSDGSLILVADLAGVARKHSQTELINSINQKYAINKTLSEVQKGSFANSIINTKICPSCGSSWTVKDSQMGYKCQNCSLFFQHIISV